jgi:hypothetical protein
MKRYVLTLFLVVGFVWSANAQQIDPQLVGTWETTDGPCTPCTLTIQANGTRGFTLAGSAVEVVFSRGTPGSGIDLVFPEGGKAELMLSKGNVLMGFYTKASRAERYTPVAFLRK